MDCDFVFASVSTLSSDAILQQDVLAPDAFDYIVIDEFHHAAANSYTKILDYFTPKFLLGLTATLREWMADQYTHFVTLMFHIL